MSATAEMNRSFDPPLRAGTARRAFHAVIALAGWALFVHWWWIVLGRVSAREIRFTLLFIAVTLVAVVGLTAWWALHNLRIFRKRQARRARLREPVPDFTRDGVGREGRLPAPPADCRVARVVVVRIRDGAKEYLPYEMPRASAAPAGTERP